MTHKFPWAPAALLLLALQLAACGRQPTAPAAPAGCDRSCLIGVVEQYLAAV